MPKANTARSHNLAFDCATSSMVKHLVVVIGEEALRQFLEEDQQDGSGGIKIDPSFGSFYRTC
ncbi:MAG: hypothetical protein EOP04_17500 [Proteobacteria bacterium]|nr:MAG: hypothetical protein EOP04_17500 [Pseudomonadota bacterium]